MVRSTTSKIWAYGINSVGSLLRTQVGNIEKICYARLKNDTRVRRLYEEAQDAGIACQECSAKDLDKITDFGVHQNIAAFCDIPPYLNENGIEALCHGKMPLFLILDCVTDPGNFGACLRSAAVCGVTAVIVPANHSAKLTPAAIKAASGAVGNVQIAQVPNLARVIRMMQDAGVWVTASASEADLNLSDMDYCRPTAFVLGAEGKGIRRLVRESCDQTVAIPNHGTIDSFNVSAATAIILYEACRQRTAGGHL